MEHYYQVSKFCGAALLVCLLAGTVQAKKTAPLPKAAKVSALPSPGIVTAMTFNIRVETFIDGPNRWDKRKKYVYDVISDQAPDVVGLQEAKIGQYHEIRRALPQYHGYAAGRDDGRLDGETCGILYQGNRFLLTESGTFWFSDTPDKPGTKDWGNLPPRICSWVRLVDKKSLSAFYVYNVHLDHMSQNSRKKSVQLLTERIAARKTSDPFIVMGDFNMELDNSAMVYLQNNTLAPMTDAWQSLYAGKPNVGTRHGFRDDTGPKIDHIPLSKGLRALSVTIDNRRYENRYPSDHYPVIAKILMPGRTFAEIPAYNKTTYAKPLGNKPVAQTMF